MPGHSSHPGGGRRKRIKHRRHAAGAGAHLMLGNSGFRNKNLRFSEKITENFRQITEYSENT
jgi:hypothetical protein